MARVFRQHVSWQRPALFASETMIMLAAVAAAAIVRLHSGLSLSQLPKALVIVLICQVCFYYSELYGLKTLGSSHELFLRIVKAVGSTSLIVGGLYFFQPSLMIGPGVFILASFAIISGLMGWRALFQRFAARVAHRERVLLVGTGLASVSLARELHERRSLDIEIVGFIDPDPAGSRRKGPDAEVIGTIDDIPRIVTTSAVDRVVLGLPDERGRMPMEKLLDMKLDGVSFDHLASVYEQYTGKIAIENLRPSWLIFSDGFRKGRGIRALKRVVDLAAAVAGLIAGAPVMAATALAIKISSHGPILFAQTRVGKHGRVFTLYKFRTMRVDAETLTGPVWAAENDPRVTTVGRFLRKTRLDELPQFWNVLRGQMSLIGPRPERPEFVRDLVKQIPFYRQRHAVHPGVTGWAQVKYQYGASVEDALQKLQYDLFYIKNMSLGLDLFIVLKTIQTVILGRGM